MTYLWALLDWGLFGPASGKPGRLGVVLRVLRYPYAVLRDLTQGEISLRAMGLVYTTLLSLIPLVAFTLEILKIFGARRELEPIVYEFFSPVGEQGARQLTLAVMQFADRASTRLVGTVGFALLAWTLIGTVKRVEDSFNFLWRVEQPRSFPRRFAEYLALLVIGPPLLVTFIGLSHAALESAPVQEVVRLPLLQRLTGTGIKLAPYAMVSVFFTFLYRFIPNTRVHLGPAVIGALVGGVLWAAIGKTFTEFVVYSTRLTVVYASFAFIVAALLWTYSGWLILLAGAQLSFYVQNPTYLRLGVKELRLSGEEHEQLALQLMYLIGQAHVMGGRLWTASELATSLQVPGIAMERMVATLERAGLLVSTADGKLVPARDIGHIRALEVLDVARSEGGGNTPGLAAIPAIDHLLAAIDAARRGGCGELTVRELVEEPPRATLTLAASSKGLLEQGTRP
jgi:membrane protein